MLLIDVQADFARINVRPFLRKGTLIPGYMRTRIVRSNVDRASQNLVKAYTKQGTQLTVPFRIEASYIDSVKPLRRTRDQINEATRMTSKDFGIDALAETSPIRQKNYRDYMKDDGGNITRLQKQITSTLDHYPGLKKGRTRSANPNLGTRKKRK